MLKSRCCESDCSPTQHDPAGGERPEPGGVEVQEGADTRKSYRVWKEAEGESHLPTPTKITNLSTYHWSTGDTVGSRCSSVSSININHTSVLITEHYWNALYDHSDYWSVIIGALLFTCGWQGHFVLWWDLQQAEEVTWTLSYCVGLRQYSDTHYPCSVYAELTSIWFPRSVVRTVWACQWYKQAILMHIWLSHSILDQFQ